MTPDQFIAAGRPLLDRFFRTQRAALDAFRIACAGRSDVHELVACVHRSDGRVRGLLCRREFIQLVCDLDGLPIPEFADDPPGRLRVMRDGCSSFTLTIGRHRNAER